MTSRNTFRRKCILIMGIFGIILLILLTGTVLSDLRESLTNKLQSYLSVSNRIVAIGRNGSLSVKKKLNLNVASEHFALKMKNRLHQLNEKCNTRDKMLKVSGRKPIFFYSPPEGFSVCKAPKTASSFLGKIVMALNSASNVPKVFSLNRRNVHGRNQVRYENISSLHGKRLLVTRDPYMRLYSAYVDKVFLLFTLGRHIAKVLKTGLYTKDGAVCGYNVTFQQFLDFTTDTALKGRGLNEHVLPISDLCYPCTVRYDMIVRQDTLSDDISYVFEQLNLTETKKKAISDSLTSNFAINTIYSLIQSYRSNYHLFKGDCPNKTLHMEKVWLSLKIQGYVSRRVSFPTQYFQNVSILDVDNVISLISKIRQTYPQTKEEVKQQRYNYVTEEYRSIRSDTIEKITKAYESDFVLFGYDRTPPHKRKTVI